MEIFPHIVAGGRGEFRISQNIWDGAFCENIQKLKALTVFLKAFVLEFQQAPEYVSKLASKCKFRMFHFKSIWVSKVTDNLTRKIKNKQQNELSNLHIFKPYVVLSNIS